MRVNTSREGGHEIGGGGLSGVADLWVSCFCQHVSAVARTTAVVREAKTRMWEEIKEPMENDFFFLVNLKEVLAKHKTAEVGKAWTGPGYCKSGWGLVDLDWQCSLGVEGTL